MTISYDGSCYCGWQKQGNTEHTIQGKLEAVLFLMTEEAIELHGSGRTDAGVHAKAQEANFYTDCVMDTAEIRNYCNRRLPEDIRVTAVREERERFHARLSASGKEYVYRIWNSQASNVFERKYLYYFPEALDVERMRRAAEFFLGEHDFKSFCGNKQMRKSTVRQMTGIEVKRLGDEIRIIYQGSGFLYHMVRIMTGTLIEVGLGKREPGEIADILEKRDRRAAGYLAPPEGLCLERVFYETDREE